jgi:nitric oxide reductase NorE protein
MTVSLPATTVSGTPGETTIAARIPVDVWIFVAIEAVIFGAYFITFMVYRAWDAELYLASQQHLSQHFGAVNTIILLVSSWLMARGVQAAREQRYDVAQKRVRATIACGGMFIASKMVEWSTKIGEGYTLTTNGFFTFYYFLTGIHVVHMLIGFGFLGVVLYQLRSPTRRSPAVIEAGGVYWHMVDFLWVIIFALLYVMH